MPRSEPLLNARTPVKAATVSRQFKQIFPPTELKALPRAAKQCAARCRKRRFVRTPAASAARSLAKPGGPPFLACEQASPQAASPSPT